MTFPFSDEMSMGKMSYYVESISIHKYEYEIFLLCILISAAFFIPFNSHSVEKHDVYVLKAHRLIGKRNKKDFDVAIMKFRLEDFFNKKKNKIISQKCICHVIVIIAAVLKRQEEKNLIFLISISLS